ncbi:DUF6531 domain-containing protein [Paraburkholderia strydomiana]|uniref:DUF6531 domain-containing protein n=1 Tax=Paraburkholderia strydomiana TaxID=1245417 RepID=UPI0038BD9CF2
MKNRTLHSYAVGMLCRLFAVFTLLFTAISANAESGDGVCAPLYVRSGAIQGTATCFANAWGNTPVNLSNHYCVNEPTRITRWCGTPPDLTQADATCPIADPVNPTSGTTTVTENDFVSGDDIPVVFSRTYRSRGFYKPDAGFGPGWGHNWQRQLGLAKVNSSPPQITASREDGDIVRFDKSSGAWRASDSKLFSLSQGPSTWALTDLATGAVETYSLQGVLLSVNVHGGQVITLTYSDSNTAPDIAPFPGLLIGITEHAPNTNSFWDITIRLSYDAKWRITKMTDVTGGVTQYGYDSNNNLTSITWPDGNVRRYAYADSRFTSALTSVIDETGTPVSTWTYDAQGRANAVSHPDATRNVSFAYGNDGTLVNYGDKALNMSFASIGNMIRPTATSSAAGKASSTWDATGNLLSQTGVSGVGRSTAYDGAGRPTRSAHTGLNGTTITSVRYADGYSLRPSMIASPGWARAFTYDAQSNMTGFSEWSTNDHTGESGFDATSDGVQKISYGFAYDSANQLNYAQVYQDGALNEEWYLSYDATGNMRQMNNRTAGTYYTVVVRDSAHRAVQIKVPGGGTALPAYDSRGRLKSFWYDEQAEPLNGNVHRLLKVDFGYSPDGRLISRRGVVSTNNGPEASISDDETDQWISNYNQGVTPVGPAVNLLGWVKALAANAEPPLMPVLAPWEAALAAVRFAWTIYQVAASDPAAILVGKVKPEIEAKQCAQTPQQLTAEEMSGILRDAASNKGNTTLGTATAEDAQALGEAWVGPGARETSDGSGLVSADGLRVYRYPSSKPNSPYATTGVQANFESKMSPTGRPYANGHLNIAP